MSEVPFVRFNCTGGSGFDFVKLHRWVLYERVPMLHGYEQVWDEFPVAEHDGFKETWYCSRCRLVEMREVGA